MITAGAGRPGKRPPRAHARTRAVEVDGDVSIGASVTVHVPYAWLSNQILLHFIGACIAHASSIHTSAQKVAKKLEIGKFRFAIFQCLQASTSYFEVKVITHHHRYVISISTIREQSKLFYVYTRLFPPLRNSTIVHQTNCIQDSNTIRIDGS
jgi:hypothetical protein